MGTKQWEVKFSEDINCMRYYRNVKTLFTREDKTRKTN
jgi:hypothetical protein